MGSVKLVGNTISTARTLRKSNFSEEKLNNPKGSCFATEKIGQSCNGKKPSTALNKEGGEKRKFKYYQTQSIDNSDSSIQDPCFVNQRAKELPWVILRPSEGFYLKTPKCETDEQKSYSTLVSQYRSLKEKACGRVPSVDYTQLLHSIKGKIQELDNPELRSEMLRKRIRGNVDRYIWNIDRALRLVDDNYFADKRLTREPQYMSGVNIEEMNLEQIQGVIQHEIEENNQKEQEQIVKRKTLQKNSKRANKLILRFQEKVKTCLTILKNEFAITRPPEFITSKPFARKYSREFFAAAKSKDTVLAAKYLEANPCLVYDVNCVFFNK